MAGQTGQASEAGIKLIRSVMKRGGWTQVLLCERLEISRSTLNQILKGQSVKLENLEEICHLLELEVGQVVLQEANSDINSLVQPLRAFSAESLRKRCGTMRILDMTQPIDSGAIYLYRCEYPGTGGGEDAARDSGDDAGLWGGGVRSILFGQCEIGTGGGAEGEGNAAGAISDVYV
jgi:DNA-binding Xre family transcriptional regulator